MYDSYTGEHTEENPHDSYDNQLLCEPVEGGKYRVTIVADEEFLNDPDTVYPVYIDPTASFNVGASGIEDVPVYSGRPQYNHGNNNYNHIGYVDSAYKVGRLLVRFPGLMEDGRFTSTATEIIDVNYRHYNLGGGSGRPVIYAYRYTGTSWSESTAKYNNIDWDSYTSLQMGSTVAGSGWYDFNITSAAKYWKENPSSASKGLILFNSDETSATYDKPFASAEYVTNTELRPSVSVTYSDYIAVSQICMDSGTRELSVNDTAQLTATVVPSNATNKGIVWTSSDNSIATVGASGAISWGR